MEYKIDRPHKQIRRQLKNEFWSRLHKHPKEELSIKLYVKIRDELMISIHNDMYQILKVIESIYN
jgi:hypothetical protein